jgi:hypothetical protein
MIRWNIFSSQLSDAAAVSASSRLSSIKWSLVFACSQAAGPGRSEIGVSSAPTSGAAVSAKPESRTFPTSRQARDNSSTRFLTPRLRRESQRDSPPDLGTICIRETRRRSLWRQVSHNAWKCPRPISQCPVERKNPPEFRLASKKTRKNANVAQHLRGARLIRMGGTPS